MRTEGTTILSLVLSSWWLYVPQRHVRTKHSRNVSCCVEPAAVTYLKAQRWKGAWITAGETALPPLIAVSSEATTHPNMVMHCYLFDPKPSRTYIHTSDMFHAQYQASRVTASKPSSCEYEADTLIHQNQVVSGSQEAYASF